MRIFITEIHLQGTEQGHEQGSATSVAPTGRSSTKLLDVVYTCVDTRFCSVTQSCPIL